MNKLDLIIDALTNQLLKQHPDSDRVTLDICVTGNGYSRSYGATRDRPEPAPVDPGPAAVEPEPAPVDHWDNLSDPDHVEPPDVLSDETPLEDSTPHPRKPVERKRGVRLFRSQVKQIKVLLRTTKLNHKEIAKRYGVTPAHISHIKRGTRWRNV